MRPLAVLARPMLSSMFIAGGLDAARNPAHRTAAAEKLGVPQPELAVRVNGAAMVLGGAALALGYKPRRSALLLAATLVPTTYAGHAFWEQDDPAQKQMHQIHFLKNVGLLGGLLLAASEPVPAGSRSARKASRAVAKAAAGAARETEKAERKVGRRAQKKADKVERRAAKHAAKIEGKAEKRVESLEGKAAEAAKVERKDTRRAEAVTRRAEKAAGHVGKAERKAEKRAARLAAKATRQANKVQEDLRARQELAAELDA